MKGAIAGIEQQLGLLRRASRLEQVHITIAVDIAQRQSRGGTDIRCQVGGGPTRNPSEPPSHTRYGPPATARQTSGKPSPSMSAAVAAGFVVQCDHGRIELAPADAENQQQSRSRLAVFAEDQVHPAVAVRVEP